MPKHPLSMTGLHGYSGEVALSTNRTIRFNLSQALSDSQPWAIKSFPAILDRATGYSERWKLLEELKDEESGAHTWRYQVQGLPDVDIVVDHIIHELTEAVLLTEWHSVSEDDFTFGSMKRDRPPQLTDTADGQATPSPFEEKRS
jgi:hypothetical protein